MSSATVDALEDLLADHLIFYHKLRSYHWNVKGPDFFELHQKFEEQYEASADYADALAERIIALDGTPHRTLTSALEVAALDEDADVPSPERMVANVVDDLETLNDRALEIIDRAEDAGHRTTANLLDDIVDEQKEVQWMFEAFLEG